MSPFELLLTLPGVCEKVSQIDGPRPSSLTAPSTWYEAVAVPQIKPGGNSRPVPGRSWVARLDPSEGSSAVETSAAPPASFANVRLEIFFIDKLPSCFFEDSAAYQ